MTDLASIANRTLDACESTNDLARRLGDAGYPHGTWISARIQSAGRGRHGRSWQSQTGNLFFSIVLRPASREHWSWVPLVCAVAAARAISACDPSREIRIKWPNDLWLGEAKVGGILCEAVVQGTHGFAIAGIGINCAHAPEGIEFPTAALETIAADRLRPELEARLLEAFATLDREGPASIREEYEERALLKSGTAVSWTPLGQAPAMGIVQGLGESGELRVRLESGEERALFAEEVRRLRSRE